MISIVIPLYNKEAYIAETINSILAQTYKSFEIILVNDGSTDNSLAVVKSFNDGRIKIIEQANAGVSVARNTGIKHANFEYVAFLDGDDWWAPTFLEEVFKAITDCPNNKIFATGRSRVFLNETERYTHALLPKDGDTEIMSYFANIHKSLPLINSSNSVFKKNIFEQKGYFRKGQKKHEDHDLWMRLCIDEPVVFINKNLSFYRKTEIRANNYYNPNDFMIFLDTLLFLKKKLSGDDLKNFNDYSSKFVLLAYIKNYGHYSKKEDSEVFKKAVEITEGKNRLLLKILKIIPYKRTYPIFKIFQK